MPLNSKGCKARISRIFKVTPNYQLVKVYTYKKNPPTASKEYSIDWTDCVVLRNNPTLVKENDWIYIKDFSIQGGWNEIKGTNSYKITIWDWELSGSYDYSKLNIEYKGSEEDDG